MLEVLLRVVMGFAILLLLVRIIGNKQLGQLNVFTYISGIVIGSMVADIILHSDIKFWRSMHGVALWVALAICVEFASLKSVKAREMLDGQPIILIKKGKIQFPALKKERLNIDDLTMMLRTNSVFSVADVDYAILEPNGDLSVLKKQEITPRQQKYIPTTIIIEGKIIAKNLKELNLSDSWLDNALNRLNILDKTDIMYAEILEDGQLHVQKM
ncbi:MAG: DUF421 domain-containing protein [Firmicutes bacterium]|nr:DUF421 domain-containing protein [Bacillota bacterium]